MTIWRQGQLTTSNDSFNQQATHLPLFIIAMRNGKITASYKAQSSHFSFSYIYASAKGAQYRMPGLQSEALLNLLNTSVSLCRESIIVAVKLSGNRHLAIELDLRLRT